MATDIKVPTLGESVTSATVARWMKQAGEAVAADEPLVELETDKVTVEVNAPAAGVLSRSSRRRVARSRSARCSARSRPATRPAPERPPAPARPRSRQRPHGAAPSAPARRQPATRPPGPVARPATPPADAPRTRRCPPRPR